MSSNRRFSGSTEIKELMVSLIGNAPIGILAFDLESRCIIANSRAGEVFKVPAERLVDISMEDLLQEWPALNISLTEAEANTRANFDVKEVALDHRIFDVRGRSLLNGRLVTFHDVTAEVNIRERQNKLVNSLEIANKELAEFAYICAHDMKSPVSSIVGLVQLLAESDEDQSDLSEVVPLLSKTADMLHKRLRSLNRILSYKQTLGKSSDYCKIGDVLENVLESLEQEIVDGNANVVTKVAQQTTLPVSATHLESVLHNLVSNAIKYCHDKRLPEIKIVAESTPDNTRITVSDNGVGFSATDNNQAYVFGLFNRLHTHVEGDGVGLYLVKSIVDSYGGSVSVNSTHDGGSTFALDIPNEN